MPEGDSGGSTHESLKPCSGRQVQLPVLAQPDGVVHAEYTFQYAWSWMPRACAVSMAT